MTTTTDEEQMRNSLESIKIKIGAAASAIISSPEHNTSKLRDLIKLLDRTKFDVFNEIEHKNTVVAIHQLVASTCCEIFKDIIPSYKIRAENSEENAKQRKQTIQLRQYEKTFCTLYKTYLQRLERMLDSLRKSSTSTFYTTLIATNLNDRVSMAKIALKCFGSLLTEHPHFNFRDQVIKKLVEFCAQSKYPLCSEIAFKSLSKALKQDKLGDVSLEISKLISDLVKTKKFSISPKIILCLLELKLIDVKVIDSEKKALKKEQREKENQMNRKLSRKERKRNKKMKKLKSSLTPAEAHSSTEEKLVYHRQILNKLFFIYFKLLKLHEEFRVERKEIEKFIKLLPPIMDGIEKFAHLLDKDMCNDLFRFISSVLENGDLPKNSLLYCLSKTCALYRALHSELDQVNPDMFLNHLNAILNGIVPYKMTKPEFECLISCIDYLIKRSRYIEFASYATFLRLILCTALSIPKNFVIDLLSAVRSMFLQKSRSLVLLESSNDSGLWRLTTVGPEYTHASTSVCWDISLLQNHYDPTIRDYAKYFVKDLLSNNSL